MEKQTKDRWIKIGALTAGALVFIIIGFYVRPEIPLWNSLTEDIDRRRAVLVTGTSPSSIQAVIGQPLETFHQPNLRSQFAAFLDKHGAWTPENSTNLRHAEWAEAYMYADALWFCLYDKDDKLIAYLEYRT